MRNNILKLSYKFVGFTIILGFVLAAYIIYMVNRDWGPSNTNNIPFEYEEFTFAFLSSFTVQANLIVAFYFLLAAIYHRREDSFILTGEKAKIFVTSYISVSATIWLTVVLPTKINWDLTTTWDWVIFIEPHIIAPVLMIFYAISNIGLTSIDFKSYCKSDLWYYLSYPIAYFICIMLRGEMRWADGKANLSYPYPFLNIHEIVFDLPGPVAFIIFLLVIFSFFIAYNLLYVYINNRKVRTQQYRELHLTTSKNLSSRKTKWFY